MSKQNRPNQILNVKEIRFFLTHATDAAAKEFYRVDGLLGYSGGEPVCVMVMGPREMAEALSNKATPTKIAAAIAAKAKEAAGEHEEVPVSDADAALAEVAQDSGAEEEQG